MSAPNHWRDLIPTAFTVNNLPEHDTHLEWLACIAEGKGDRLNCGIAAIGELLDSAESANCLDEGVAVDICLMLAALAGLSAQLATVTCNANRALASIRAAANHRPAPPHLSPVS